MTFAGALLCTIACETLVLISRRLLVPVELKWRVGPNRCRTGE